MKTSCIITTYNRRNMVVEALASVYNQRRQDLEVIVVDDGSTDGTADFLAGRFAGLNLVSLDGVGPGLARNAGVDTAEGDVVMLLDSDDIWLPGHVEKLLKVMSSGYEVAYGTTLTRDLIRDAEFLIPEDGNGIKGDCLASLCRWCFMVPSAVAFTRKAYQQVGGFAAGRMGEDWAFFVRLAERFAFGFAGPEPVTLRRLHEGSLCCGMGRESFINGVRAVGNLLRESDKVDRLDLQRFQAMEDWIMNNGKGCFTVQDWYSAMKREGMI